MTIAPDITEAIRSNRQSPGFRSVVFHADDFGFNEPITRGIIEGFERGVLTSTSALANAPFLDLALSFWKSLDERRRSDNFPSAPLRKSLGDELTPFDMGVHLNLTQGRPLTGEGYPPQLLDGSGFFPGIYVLYAKLALQPRRYVVPIRRELEAQIARLKDASLPLTQLNGHQYLEILPVVARMVPDLARRFDIPVIRTAAESNFTPITLHKGELENWVTSALKRYYALKLRRTVLNSKLATPEKFFGAAHMGRVRESILSHYLQAVPLTDPPDNSIEKLTEICLHPATPLGVHTLVESPGWADPFERSRPEELQFIESPECLELLRNYRVRLRRLSSLVR